MSDDLATKEQALREELAGILKPPRVTEIEQELAAIAEAKKQAAIAEARAEYQQAEAEYQAARGEWGKTLARRDELRHRRKELLRLAAENRASPDFGAWQDEFWRIETTLAQIEWACWDRKIHPFSRAGTRGVLNRAVSKLNEAKSRLAGLGVEVTD